jgi:hypothetical protein
LTNQFYGPTGGRCGHTGATRWTRKCRGDSGPRRKRNLRHSTAAAGVYRRWVMRCTTHHRSWHGVDWNNITGSAFRRQACELRALIGTEALSRLSSAIAVQLSHLRAVTLNVSITDQLPATLAAVAILIGLTLCGSIAGLATLTMARSLRSCRAEKRNTSCPTRARTCRHSRTSRNCVPCRLSCGGRVRP